MTRDQVLAEAMALTPEDRQSLVEELLLTIPQAEREAIDDAWVTEVRRRDEALASGQMKKSPMDEVIARVLSRGRQ